MMRRPTHEGATLVEVLLAVVLLTVLAVAGVAFLYHSRATISIQRNRQVALAVANGRLEALRASSYTNMSPAVLDYTVRYLSPGGAGDWNITAGDPGETAGINGRNLPVITTVQYIDVDGGSASYDAVRLTVNAEYRVGTSDKVTLQTIRAP